MIELERRKYRFPDNTRLLAVLLPAIVAPIMGLAVAQHAYAESTATPYPKMAALNQYLMAQDAEIALAKSAAPESIAKDADVLVLDRSGYRTEIKGHNGFVCVVQRSWTAALDHPDFWNPKLRAPTCFNAAAVRSFLPRVVKRTNLILAGKTKEQLAAAMKAALDAKEIPAVESGSMAYMLSKQGYLNDHDGHWHPHIMVFVSQEEPESWGANLTGSQVFGAADHTDRVCTFYIPVAKWSDGSADSIDHESH
jgi:hypothetical protein